MICDIQSNSDFLTGATLTVLIPEDELDKKALMTIQEDLPDFILPFRCRSIDGNIELVYHIGRHNKLQYIAGVRRPEEYAQIWYGVLNPLLCCGDWFMKPYSLALDAGYLYYEKDKKTISYVYIPTLNDCADYNDLKEMAVEVSKLIPVSDPNLENRVLKAIMKDFKPKDFLSMLRTYMEENRPVEVQQTIDGFVNQSTHQTPQVFQQPHPPQELQHPQLFHPPQPLYPPLAPDAAPGDVIISIPANKMHSKKKRGKAWCDITSDTKEGKGKEAEGKEAEGKEAEGKEAKEPEKTGGRMGLFGKRKAQHPEDSPEKSPATVAQEEETPKLFAVPSFPLTHVDSVIPAPPETCPDPVCPVPGEINDTTQEMEVTFVGARLSYVGRGQLPLVIYVPIKQGEVFTIGRYDIAEGRAQSSFEFDRKTRAVSRRHAAIEFCADGYKIIDLTSSAGTFVNVQKIPPNTPVELEHGCRVSFGNSGADYIWENQ